MARKPRLLVVLHKMLGHKTYGTQVEQAISNRDDAEISILSFSTPKLKSLPMKRFNIRPYERAYRQIDPILAYRNLFGRNIRRAIDEFKPDVVHFGPHIPAGSIAFRKDAPPFTVALDCTRAGMERSMPKHVWTQSEFDREAELFRNAARLYPWSTWAADSLVSDCGVERERIEIMPPSTDTTKFKPPQHDRKDGPARIVFVGNDFLRKGGDRLHRWVTGPLADKCELHIISGDPDADVKGDNIVFHGRVPNETLISELLPTMDLMCHPTRSDMSAYVAIEAAGAGIPCVASAIGGIPDIVEDGVSGRLIPVDDDEAFVSALTEILTSTELRQRMSAAAVARAQERFDSTKNYNKMIDQMKQLAS